MKDILAHLDKLRTEGRQCALIRDLAPMRRNGLFTRVATHLTTLADELENALAAGLPKADASMVASVFPPSTAPTNDRLTVADRGSSAPQP
jgi:hypothetical protein